MNTAHISRTKSRTPKIFSPNRCVPLVDAVMFICLSVENNQRYALFERPKVKYYASCWNQLVVHAIAFRRGFSSTGLGMALIARKSTTTNSARHLRGNTRFWSGFIKVSVEYNPSQIRKKPSLDQ